MTEPFAVPIEDEDDFGFIVWIKGQKICDGMEKKSAYGLADHINAAFNRRLDEEISKVLGDVVDRMETIPCSYSVYGDLNTSRAASYVREVCVGIVEAVKAGAEWERGK